MKHWTKWDCAGTASGILSFLLYVNTFKATFVYDDNRAILANPDILTESSWTSMWQNDFWGTPLLHSGSHKSYRPLSVLTFRFNFSLCGFSPFGYHLTNVLLHVVTTLIFVKVAKIIFSPKNNRAVLFSSLLFACHPIHTEAVAGVVGRADILCTGLALLTFIAYVNHIKWRTYQYKVSNNKTATSPSSSPVPSSQKQPEKNTKCQVIVEFDSKAKRYRGSSARLKSFFFLSMTIVLGASSMLAKEQGITILLVCAIYDFVRSVNKCKISKKQEKASSYLSIVSKEIGPSLIVLFLGLVLILRVRLFSLGRFEFPTFSRSDNPTSHEQSFWIRLATFLYLPVFNLLLLLHPWSLSYDWSMESIPRIKQISDPRNLFSLFVYALITMKMFMCIRNLLGGGGEGKVSRNLQFGGAGKLAKGIKGEKSGSSERRKHSPKCCRTCKHSIRSGGSHRNNNYNNNNSDDNSSAAVKRRKLSKRTTSTSSAAAAARLDEPDSHRSIISARSESAFFLISSSFLIIPFIPASNLLAYVGFVIAERVLYFPSVGFCLLIGHGFNSLLSSSLVHQNHKVKNLFLLIGALSLILLSLRTLRRNEDWQDEERLYRSGINVNPAKSWGNLGSVLSNQGRNDEAEHAYRTALSYRNNMADVHYNLGLLLENQARLSEALTFYRSAIHFRPLLAAAYVNLGQVLERLGKTEEAIGYYQKVQSLSDEGVKDLRSHKDSKATAFLKLGRITVDKKPDLAINYYNKALKVMPPSFQYLQSIYSSMGEAFFKMDDTVMAEQWFKATLEINSVHLPTALLYGKLLAKNKTEEAQKKAEVWFRRAKKIAPTDPSPHFHYAQFLEGQGKHAEAIENLILASTLSPNDPQILLEVSRALRNSGDKEKAFKYYQKAQLINQTRR